jgi:hypothetical protein
MSNVAMLKVGNRYKKSTELDYEDLVMLYREYIDKNNRIPKYSDCLSKNNLPQGRIITKILKSNNTLYSDFLSQFDKYDRCDGRCRIEYTKENYDISVKKLIDLSNKNGSSLKFDELTSFGLPNAKWFIKYCPDEKVKTYPQFLNWCGLKRNLLKINKEYVDEQLIKLENKLNRPILREDICVENVGFSMIVINRIYGGLNNAKKEIGLKQTNFNKPLRTYDFYKNHIDKVLENFKLHNNRKYINWTDIENIEIDGYKCEHKTIINAFKRENIDFFAYIKSKGFVMNNNNWSYKYTFDDGEKIVSSMEYDVSKYLKEIGLIYKKDYFRDVRYSTFSNEESKINCDYKICFRDKILYVEVAGMIHYKNNLWRKYDFKNKKNNDYRDKMVKKEKILKNNNCNYLFLFPDDFYNDDYIRKIKQKLTR